MASKNKNRYGKITEFFQSLFNNAVAHDIYYDHLKEVTIGLYQWLNLPKEIDERFLELTLFEQGHVLFFKDEIMDQYVVTKAALEGKWNIYNIPIRRKAYASNGYKNNKTSRDSVIIYNNNLHTSSEAETLYYADKIGFYDRVIDINVNAQKTPILIKCSENKRLSMKNLYMNYAGNEPVIFADDSMDVSNPIQVLKTDAPFVAPDIYEMKVKYWNEFLTFKGVSNVATVKKERMTNDEVYRQLGGSFAARGSGLKMRKQAAQQINEMFGLEIDVIFNEEYQQKVNDAADEIFDPEDGNEPGPDLGEGGQNE